MKLNYEPLSKHIQLVDYRNSGEVTSTVLGISIDKEFMPSVANVIGTDLSRYKLISKGLFACNPMHVGRDERLPIALYGIEELFETGKHISVDIFSDEYLDKINAIQLPNTKIKVLQRLLSQAIDEYKKVNRIMGMEFSDRLKRVVDEYNNRRRDEAFANEVLDDVAEQLAKLLEELKKEKDSFKGMGIDYEEKAFYDILKAVAKKYEFEYPDDKMIELSKRIKLIVDDKAKYTDWSTRDDIKANLQVDLILLLDEFDYPPVTIDDVYKEVLEQAENFKKYSE